MKQLWLLVGGNGSGKTTFFRKVLEPMGLAFVNADDIARLYFPEAPEAHSYEAALIAAHLRGELLEKGVSFCFETVYSHPGKIDFLARAKALGYETILVFLHLSQSTLNKARVSQRVAAGGHSVPEDKIESRIPRTLTHVAQSLPLCDEVWFIDNDDARQPLRLVCRTKQGRVVSIVDNPPDWLGHFLHTR